MSQTELVERLIRGTVQRAVQETLAALVVVAAFTAMMWSAPGPRSSGCALILAGTVVIVGVVWRFALSPRLLEQHPATDAAYWQGVCRSQARLLRLVPVWYIAPLCPGLVLFTAPTDPDAGYAVALAVAALTFGGIIWLNRMAARKYDEAALALAA